MSLESLYGGILAHRVPIILLLLGSPWVTYISCYMLSGRKAEPLLLNVNLYASMFSLFMLAGYLVYATNTGGWAEVVTKADIFLLALPIYHFAVSLWLSSFRLPLRKISAFRRLQGLAMIGIAAFACSLILSKIRIIFFSYLPFEMFVGGMALLVMIGYAGYRKLVSDR